MKSAYLIVALVSGLLGLAAGFFFLPGHDGGSRVAATDGEATDPLYWVAPMDPAFRSDGPGKSPMGMDLIPIYEDAGIDGPGVRISPDVVHNFGVRTEPVRRQALTGSVRTFGNVVLAEPQVEHVHTRVAGWIESLVADVEGDPVNAGDVLLEIYAPDLVRAQEEYLLARRSGDASLQVASGHRLRALGMAPAQITDLGRTGEVAERIQIRASRDGFVMSLSVRQGMFVEPRTEVMAIASLDPVWVVAEVFEHDVPRVAPGKTARLKFDFLPDRTFVGAVDYVYPELDPRVRTLRLRIAFDNADGALRPGMFGDVELVADGGAQVLVVPASAVIRGTSLDSAGESPDRVVVQIDEQRFSSRAVRIGRVEPDRIEILAGLREGERVVVSGQFLIDSESNVVSDLLRMGAPAGAGVCALGVPARGTFLAQLASDEGQVRVRIDHEPVPALAWPAMVMPFTVAADAELPVLAAGTAISFCIDRKPDGAILVSNLAPDLGIATGAVAGDPMARGSAHAPSMDHGSMDHESVDHGPMDHGSMDHGSMDHESMDHESMDHESVDPALMDHGSMDPAPMDHGSMDHESVDPALMDHGSMDHESMDPAPMDQSSLVPSTSGMTLGARQ